MNNFNLSTACLEPNQQILQTINDEDDFSKKLFEDLSLIEFDRNTNYDNGSIK